MEFLYRGLHDKYLLKNVKNASYSIALLFIHQLGPIMQVKLQTINNILYNSYKLKSKFLE